jgi:hypothetical protein
MDFQETASERIAKVAGKYKGHLAVGAAGAAAGAYAAHRGRKKFERSVDKEVHMRKARYAQLREARLSTSQRDLLVGAKSREAKMRAVANDPKASRQYGRAVRVGKLKYHAGRTLRGAATGALIGGAGLRALGSKTAGGNWHGVPSGDRANAMKLAMGVGAAIGGGASAVHGGSNWKHARIKTKALNKAYGKKLSRDYKAEDVLTREDVIEALMAEMAPAVNVARQGTPATNAARELMRSRKAKGGALAVGALGAGALAMRARANRRQQEEGRLDEFSTTGAKNAAKYVARNAKTPAGRYSMYYSAGQHLSKHKGKYGVAVGVGAGAGAVALRARKRRQKDEG